MLAFGAQRQKAPTGRLAGLAQRRRRTWEGAGRGEAGMKVGALGSLRKGPRHPSRSCPRTHNNEDSDWHLGSWLQGRHEVFDHFGFRDCDAAHHEEDQERVVAGMRPAHLQNKRPLLAIRSERGL